MTVEDLRGIREQLIRHEGLRLKAYRCTAGKITIGVGRNLEDKGITTTEAEDMLTHDIEECIVDLGNHFPWFAALDPIRQKAVIDFRFNLGPTRFRQFVRFLLSMKVGKYDRAADELLQSKWALQVQPSRVRRIVHQIRTGTEMPA